MPPNEDVSGSSGLGAAPPPDRDGGDAAATASAGSAKAGTDVQAYIGRQLRAVYDDVVKQPIPDRFLALMKQLEEGTREP